MMVGLEDFVVVLKRYAESGEQCPVKLRMAMHVKLDSLLGQPSEGPNGFGLASFLGGEDGVGASIKDGEVV